MTARARQLAAEAYRCVCGTVYRNPGDRRWHIRHAGDAWAYHPAEQAVS